MSELRFTDDPPPRAILENVPNWVHAYGEEGRRGQDETTIKPQARQDRIDNNTRYTTADVWLPSGDTGLALLRLSSGEVTGLSVYEGDTIWCVRSRRLTGRWQIDDYCNPIRVRLDDPSRFPLRYCSRLPYTRRRPLKGMINADGSWSEWVIEET
jgi:hypothetical protein